MERIFHRAAAPAREYIAEFVASHACVLAVHVYFEAQRSPHQLKVHTIGNDRVLCNFLLCKRWD